MTTILVLVFHNECFQLRPLTTITHHPPPTTHHQLLYTRLEKKVRITTQKLYMFS
jgi:hypothetical protein